MRIIKNILFAFIGLMVVFAVILAVNLNNYDDQDYKVLLVKSVNNLTDHTLAIEGAFELNGFLNPVLSASSIKLHSKKDDSSIHIGHFRIQFALASLLNNTLLINDLLLENVDAEIQSNEDSTKKVTLDSHLPTPIFTHAALKNINLRVDDNKQIYTLDNLLISAKNKHSPLIINGHGRAIGHIFNIKGQLGAVDNIFIQSKFYPVNLQVNWKQTQLSIEGNIADLSHGKGFDLIGKIQSPDISVLPAFAQFKGHFSGMGHLTGDFSTPILSELQATWQDKQLINLQITGSIGNLWTHEQTNLHLSGFIHDAKLLKQIMQEHSLPFSRFNIDVNIANDDQGYMLQNLDATLHDELGFKVTLTGSARLIQDNQPFRAVDIQAKISSKDTATINPYLGNVLPEMGPVEGSAYITTQGQDFILSNINLLAGANQKTQLLAKGRIGPLSIDPKSKHNKIALDLKLHAKQSSALASLFGVKHPELGAITVTARLEGASDLFTLTVVKINTHFSDILSIQADGQAVWKKLKTGSFQQSIDFTVQAHSSSIQDAFLIYDEYLPDIGPAEAFIRIHGTGTTLSGSDLTVQLGTKNSLFLSAQGKIAEISITDSSYKGLELSGTLAGKNTSDLSKLLKIKELPNIGALSGEFLLKGDSNTLQVSQFTLSAGRKNQLRLNASGKISKIPLQQKTQLQEVDIDLTATMPSSADLALFLESEIPDIGRLSIKGKLTDHKNIFAIDNLLVTISNPNKPDINVRGNIQGILSANNLYTELLFNEGALIGLFGLQPIPELGSLQGRIFLSNAEGSFSLKNLKLKLDHTELIAIKVHDIKTEAKEDEVYVNTDIFIKHPTLFGKSLDIDFPWRSPISFSGTFQGNKEKVTIKGNSFMGKTKISSNLILSLANKKNKVSGTINSPNLFLKDFGITPELWQNLSPNSPAQQATLFSRTPLSLQALHKIDLDLQLRIFKVTGVNYKVDKVAIDLLLQNGKLTADPSAFIFTAGHITMNAVVDATKKPEWMLSIQADNIQLSKLLEQQNKPSPVEGELNFFIDLKSSGISTHEMAENLNGEAGFRVEKGGISRGQLELAFLNPLGWLFSLGLEDEFRISCGLASYQIEQGVIRSNVFIVDGPKLLILGKTEVNLAENSINSLYNLEKKNVFDKSIFPTFSTTDVPIKVSGSILNPIIKQASISSVESITDRYIFSPITVIPQEVLGTLLGIFDRHKNKPSPCQELLK